MLYSIYRMTVKILKLHVWCENVKIFPLFTQRYNRRQYVSLKSVNHYSCIGIRYAKLFEAAKISCSNHEILVLFEHGFYLTKPMWAPICLHVVTRESVAALTNHSAYAFVREKVACVYDVVATL